MTDKKFIDGLRITAPRDGAPDYIRCRIGIKRADLIAWLQQQQGDWVNADVKVSQAGNWYAQVDDWKPSNRRQTEVPKHVSEALSDGFSDDDIPW